MVYFSELNGSIPASPDTAPVVNGSVLRDAEGETMEDFAPEEIPPKSVDFGKFILVRINDIICTFLILFISV